MKTQMCREPVAGGAGDSLVGVRTAPLVVGNPGGRRRKQQQRRTRFTPGTPDEDDVIIGDHLAAAPRREGDDVAPGTPGGGNGHAPGNRPAAASGRGVIRSRMPVAGKIRFVMNRNGLQAVPRDVEIEGVGIGRHMEFDDLAHAAGKARRIGPDLQNRGIVACRVVPRIDDVAGPYCRAWHLHGGHGAVAVTRLQ